MRYFGYLYMLCQTSVENLKCIWRCDLRIDYGLPKTSISSLLTTQNTQQNSQNDIQSQDDIQAQQNGEKSTNETLKQSTQKTKPPQKIQKATLEKAQKDSLPKQDLANPLARETYGMEILELMSDEEYTAFVRASEGMSEGEKVIAAQALYSLREDYQGQGAHKRDKNPYTKTNRAFSRHNDFLERYKAFYYGVEKVEILG